MTYSLFSKKFSKVALVSCTKYSPPSNLRKAIWFDIFKRVFRGNQGKTIARIASRTARERQDLRLRIARSLTLYQDLEMKISTNNWYFLSVSLLREKNICGAQFAGWSTHLRRNFENSKKIQDTTMDPIFCLTWTCRRRPRPWLTSSGHPPHLFQSWPRRTARGRSYRSSPSHPPPSRTAPATPRHTIPPQNIQSWSARRVVMKGWADKKG